MNNSEFSNYISGYAKQIDLLIASFLKNKSDIPIVPDAMKYSLSVGGKRLRPILLLEFCKLCGGDVNLSKEAAVAIEMLHTYSLIHDDLPCMDNDDLRRGQPSCHKKFGEEYALLAGDALLTQSFFLLSNSALSQKYPEHAIKLSSILSSCAGVCGMIGGQAIDLSLEGKAAKEEDLFKMDYLKTSKLIEAACTMGVVCANGSAEDLSNASNFAKGIGIAFQIIDDILDVVADEKALGKPVGSDAANNKNTYVSLLGLEKSKALAEKYTNEAVLALSSYGEKADFLVSLAKYLLNRIK